MKAIRIRLLDTQRLISEGVSADNKTATEDQMILNHKDAIEFIVQNTEEIGFNRYTVLNLHALLSNNLLPNPGLREGYAALVSALLSLYIHH